MFSKHRTGDFKFKNKFDVIFVQGCPQNKQLQSISVSSNQRWCAKLPVVDWASLPSPSAFQNKTRNCTAQYFLRPVALHLRAPMKGAPLRCEQRGHYSPGANLQGQVSSQHILKGHVLCYCSPRKVVGVLYMWESYRFPVNSWEPITFTFTLTFTLPALHLNPNLYSESTGMMHFCLYTTSYLKRLLI